MPFKFSSYTLALWAALPMARTAQVESRLKMILKPNASRRALTRRAVIASLAAAALGVGTLAALRPTAQAQNEATVKPTAWKQTLPNGATVELLGIADVPPYKDGWWRKDDPPPRRGWWQPDGSPLAAAPIDSDKQMTPVGTKDVEAWRQFAVRVSPPPGAAASSIGTTFDLSRTPNLAESGSMQATRQGRPVPNIWQVGARFGDLQKQPVIRCGVAAGAWETLRTKSAQEGFEMTSTAPYFFDYGENYGEDTPSHGHGQVVFSRASLVGGAAAITVTHVLPSDRAQVRVVAVDLNGKVFADGNEDDTSSMAVGDTNQATYVFKGLPLSRVRAFRFQARLYQWAEFTGIALKPGKK